MIISSSINKDQNFLFQNFLKKKVEVVKPKFKIKIVKIVLGLYLIYIWISLKYYRYQYECLRRVGGRRMRFTYMS